MKRSYKGIAMPDEKGYFGEFGGQYLPENLQKVMNDIRDEYEQVINSDEFKKELADLFIHYVGRPSPIYHAKKLSAKLGGAQIYLKREDLNHTGAHKINHCLGEALLAKHMGKTKVIAETGAGQHGVALATACALLGLPCEIYMGSLDIEREHPNVTRMKILGAKVVSVDRGRKTLKDAVDAAFDELVKDPENFFYAIGSAVGPHPFPMMVHHFQSVVGQESREQMLEMTGRLPDYVLACVGGGSNSIGMFDGFINDEKVKLIGVEPAGRGLHTEEHAAAMTKGAKGVIHGFKCYVLQEENGEIKPVYSVAAGLDYPGVGPAHCLLNDLGRAEYASATDAEALDAFMTLSREEGIIPALESSHAVAYAMKIAPSLPQDCHILINLSGRGDKDCDSVAQELGL